MNEAKSWGMIAGLGLQILIAGLLILTGSQNQVSQRGKVFVGRGES